MLRRSLALLAAVVLAATLVTPAFAYCVPGRVQQHTAQDGVLSDLAEPGVHFSWIGASISDFGQYVYPNETSFAWLEIHSPRGLGIARIGVKYTPGGIVYAYKFVSGDDGTVYVDTSNTPENVSNVDLSISTQWSTKHPGHINAATLHYGSQSWTYNMTVDDAWEPVYAVFVFRTWNRANSFGGSYAQPFTWVNPTYQTQYGTGRFTTNLSWSHEESWMQHAYNPIRLWDLAC